MTQPLNPKLVKHIARYLRTPPNAEANPAETRLVERIALACRKNRDKTASGGRATAIAATPGILWNPTPTPTKPPRWTQTEAARFLALVARTDDLTGNCC